MSTHTRRRRVVARRSAAPLLMGVLAMIFLGGPVPAPTAQTTAPQVLFSTSSARAPSQALDGQTVSGSIYVFAQPDAGTQARFWVDDESMVSSPRQVEKTAPWDLSGGNSDGTARPLDTRTLSDGQHSVTVAITTADGGVNVAHARFTVINGAPEPPTPTVQLLVSASASRSPSQTLEGQSVSGLIYVFAKPDTGTEARFWVDDTTMTSTPRPLEKNPPWDLAGGNSDGTARPLDTRTLPDGAHTVSVAIRRSDGTLDVAHARFSVANSAPIRALDLQPATLGFSGAPGSAPQSRTLDLVTVDGSTTSYSVSDDAPWLTVTPNNGGTPAQLTLTADPAGLPAGTYQANVTASAAGYSSDTTRVTLSIANAAAPDQIHLAWVDDPSSTMTFVWHTGAANTPSNVRYRATGTTEWQTVTGAIRPSGTTGALHEATARGLSARTRYEYQVQGEGGTWSAMQSTRTAPMAGPADFDVVYVADTGLVGRTDGLAEATQQVIDAIATLDPLLVLPGGDYAYFNTDTRYVTLDGSIDAWFRQMQPVAARAPLMPTYGNHEVLLGEGFTEWAQRFPTPAGLDGRRNYSFDIGDVHFVSILAVQETSGLTSQQLSWIEQDVRAAQAAGKRWVLPYYHVSPFADGTSHPSNLALRGQLGPLFERLGIDVALASHDQSYERTFPLVEVPAANRRTSSSLRCYTPADGTTYLKVSPGGKLSSKNNNFSGFRTFPPPAYTAFRDATAHHFVRLRFSASGTLRVEVFALTKDGGAPVVQDSFEYSPTCPPELEFSTSTAPLEADPGGAASTSVDLRASGSGAIATLTDDAPWLDVSPGSGSTPLAITLRANAAELAPGVHRATVTATAPGTAPAQLSVAFTVRESVSLRVSTRPDRAGAIGLGGATVAGVRYVFLTPSSGATRVRFWLDNPAASGSPRQTENNAPWDFAGGNTDGSARPFDTRTLGNGSHTITAIADLPGGSTRRVDATFTVANP